MSQVREFRTTHPPRQAILFCPRIPLMPPKSRGQPLLTRLTDPRTSFLNCGVNRKEGSGEFLVQTVKISKWQEQTGHQGALHLYRQPLPQLAGNTRQRSS